MSKASAVPLVTGTFGSKGFDRSRPVKTSDSNTGFLVRSYSDPNYFKHAVAKHTLSRLATFVWWRVVHWVMHRNRMTWKAIRRWLHTPQGWGAIRMDGIELFNLATVPVTRYRYRGNSIPTPWPEL